MINPVAEIELTELSESDSDVVFPYLQSHSDENYWYVLYVAANTNDNSKRVYVLKFDKQTFTYTYNEIFSVQDGVIELGMTIGEYGGHLVVVNPTGSEWTVYVVSKEDLSVIRTMQLSIGECDTGGGGGIGLFGEGDIIIIGGGTTIKTGRVVRIIENSQNELILMVGCEVTRWTNPILESIDRYSYIHIYNPFDITSEDPTEKTSFLLGDESVIVKAQDSYLLLVSPTAHERENMLLTQYTAIYSSTDEEFQTWKDVFTGEEMSLPIQNNRNQGIPATIYAIWSSINYQIPIEKAQMVFLSGESNHHTPFFARYDGKTWVLLDIKEKQSVTDFGLLYYGSDDYYLLINNSVFNEKMRLLAAKDLNTVAVGDKCFHIGFFSFTVSDKYIFVTTYGIPKEMNSENCQEKPLIQVYALDDLGITTIKAHGVPFAGVIK